LKKYGFGWLYSDFLHFRILLTDDFLYIWASLSFWCFLLCRILYSRLFWFSDSLKQVVGHEAIKLLVSVDEDGYEAGRLKLLQNLKN
jgi:hypothetical protein